MNPFTLLDNILSEYASPKVRRLVHLAILLVTAVVTIYFAAGGDWTQFAIALAAALYAGANKANTPAPEKVDDVTEYTGEVSGNPEPGTYEDESGEQPLP